MIQADNSKVCSQSIPVLLSILSNQAFWNQRLIVNLICHNFSLEFICNLFKNFISNFKLAVPLASFLPEFLVYFFSSDYRFLHPSLSLSFFCIYSQHQTFPELFERDRFRIYLNSAEIQAR